MVEALKVVVAPAQRIDKCREFHAAASGAVSQRQRGLPVRRRPLQRSDHGQGDLKEVLRQQGEPQLPRVGLDGALRPWRSHGRKQPLTVRTGLQLHAMERDAVDGAAVDTGQLVSAHPVKAAIATPTVGHAVRTAAQRRMGAKAVGNPAHQRLESLPIAVQQDLAYTGVTRCREEGPVVGQQRSSIQQFVEGRERKPAAESMGQRKQLRRQVYARHQRAAAEESLQDITRRAHGIERSDPGQPRIQ